MTQPSDEIVERVARIIDPSSWAAMDGYLADMKRKYRGQNAAYDPDNFKHKPSMKVARAAITATGLVEEVERLRAKLAEYDKPECICPKCGIRHGGSFVRGEF
jgi:hypothetical protein